MRLCDNNYTAETTTCDDETAAAASRSRRRPTNQSRCFTRQLRRRSDEVSTDNTDTHETFSHAPQNPCTAGAQRPSRGRDSEENSRRSSDVDNTDTREKVFHDNTDAQEEIRENNDVVDKISDSGCTEEKTSFSCGNKDARKSSRRRPRNTIRSLSGQRVPSVSLLPSHIATRPTHNARDATAGNSRPASKSGAANESRGAERSEVVVRGQMAVENGSAACLIDHKDVSRVHCQSVLAT